MKRFSGMECIEIHTCQERMGAAIALLSWLVLHIHVRNNVYVTTGKRKKDYKEKILNMHMELAMMLHLVVLW